MKYSKESIYIKFQIFEKQKKDSGYYTNFTSFVSQNWTISKISTTFLTFI